jgi:uncharacterized membrane protein YfcA
VPDLTAAVLLAAVAGAVGFFIGSVGIGGVLLIPFLVILGGLGIHAAAATALFTFLFTGLLGSWLFQRRGTISWRLALPVCAGALVFGYLGTLAAAHIGATALTTVIAILIIVAGVYIFFPQRWARRERDGHAPGDVPLLAAVGVVSGFGSGLSGAGGPLFSVPIMVVLGFAPLSAVGASQVLQIVAALSSSLAAVQDGRIDFGIAAWVTGFELVGVAVGVRLAHAVSALVLRRMAAGLCIVVGTFMLVRIL